MQILNFKGDFFLGHPVLSRVSIPKVCISKEIRKAYAWLPGVGSGMRGAAAACDQKAHTNENYRPTREAKYVT